MAKVILSIISRLLALAVCTKRISTSRGFKPALVRSWLTSLTIAASSAVRPDGIGVEGV